MSANAIGLIVVLCLTIAAFIGGFVAGKKSERLKDLQKQEDIEKAKEKDAISKKSIAEEIKHDAQKKKDEMHGHDSGRDRFDDSLGKL